MFSEQALSLLEDYYCKEGESPEDAFKRASYAYCGGDKDLAERIFSYAKNKWFMFSSPILSNAPAEGETPKGLPISCFVSYVDDSLEGLIEHSTELRWLSVKGGGVGGHWSAVRGESDIAPGPIPFIKTVDSDMVAYRQGKTRKGSYASYLDVSHPSIKEYIGLRTPTGGDSNRKCLNLHIAVNLPDTFMNAVLADNIWELKDPHTSEVVETVKARDIWEAILETRGRTGEPYLNFIDTVNSKLNPFLQLEGLKVHGSNLCNEIHLPTGPDRTAVCCLSSVNLEYFDQWSNTNMVRDLIRFLDNVLEHFIKNAPKELSKAIKGASEERSLGLGAMGFHSLLQSKGIPFEGVMAEVTNRQVFSFIKKEAMKETELLAKERGEPILLEGSGTRNAHLLAVAPNANSSIIAGCSPSIEPWKSNAFTHRTRAGSHLVKNGNLEKLLEHKQRNTEDTWKSIILNKGSVQHLDFLSDWEKEVYKTAVEIDQRWIIDHAATRQEFICQGQSVNLFFPPESERSYVNSVHLRAWNKGLKGLYYYRTSSITSAEQVGIKVKRESMKEQPEEECLSCQG